MPIYSAQDGVTSDLGYGLDTEAANVNAPSLSDEIGDFVTKGVPLTGMSVVNSFANTGIELYNLFGGDASKLSVEDYTDDQNTIDYYHQHEQGIEAAGLLVGALIPGGVALKGYGLAMKAATDAYEGYTLGKNVSTLARAAGFLPAVAKSGVIKEAIANIPDLGNGLYGSLLADKVKVVGLAFADQALMSLTMEAAVASTMHASPLLDSESLSDVVENSFHGAALGGLFLGAAVDGFFSVAQINRAAVNFEKLTKPAEEYTRLGQGAFANQDRIVKVLQSVDKIPVEEMQATKLGTEKLTATTNAALTEVRSLIGNMTNGDAPLGNAVTDLLLKQRASGSDKDTLYMQWARRNNFARLDLDNVAADGSFKAPGTTPTDGLLFLNKFKGRNDNPPSLNELFTDVPHPDSTVSLAYRMKPGAVGEPNILDRTSVIEMEGNKVAIDTAPKAFAAGADIFIGQHGNAFVNPDSSIFEQVARPGEGRILTQREERVFRETGAMPSKSRAFYSSPEIWDSLTGKVVDGDTPVIPTIGDVGVPKVNSSSVVSGDYTFFHSIEKGLTSDTNPTEANSRYLWASVMGVPNKAAIQENDIPMMEQLYNKLQGQHKGNFEDFMQTATKQGISYAGKPVADAFSSSSDMLDAIATSKAQFAAQYILANGKNSLQGAALLTNLPEENMLKALSGELDTSSPANIMADINKSTGLRHFLSQQRLGNVMDQQGNILRGMQEVQYRINQIKDGMDTAVSAWSSRHGLQLSDFQINKPTKDFLANVPVGAKFLQFAQGAYGSAAQATEVVGRNVSRLTNSRYKAITDALAPHSRALLDDRAAALESLAFVAARQRTGEKFVLLPHDLVAEHFPSLLSKDNTGREIAVLKDSLITDEEGKVTWDQDHIPEGFVKATLPTDDASSGEGEYKAGLRNFYNLSPKVAKWEIANRQLNDTRIINENSRRAALGLTTKKSIEPGVLYTPPIDTSQNPYFVYVKQKAGTPFSDDGTGIMTANSPELLRQKIASLGPDYETYTKGQLEAYKKAYGEYDYSKNFYDSRINTDLTRRGILNDVIPSVNAENMVARYVDWHARLETKQIRDFTELANGQLFAELDSMGDRFNGLSKSKMQNSILDALAKQDSNPFSDYKRLALNISPKDQYTFWNYSQEKIEALADTAFRTMRQAVTAVNTNAIDISQANEAMKAAGLGDPFGNVLGELSKARYNMANSLPPTRYLTRIIAAQNTVLSAGVVTYDTMQQTLHAITTVMLSAAEGTNVMTGGIARELYTTPLPSDEGKSIFAVAKPIGASLKNFFRQNSDPEVAARLPMYKRILGDQTTGRNEVEQLEGVSLPFGNITNEKAESYLGKLNTVLSKPFNMSEGFSNFVAADIGYNIFSKLGYEGKELEDNIWSFVNRVKTNRVTAQRPVAFQGPIGQAVGLFQSFYLNMMQVMLRHVANGEAKSSAMLLGLQGTLFGAQGLPGFNMINQAVATAHGNTSNADVYSTLPNYMGKTMADYLLYGSVSNVLGASMYTRAEMNPRNVTVLPVNPLEWAGISGGIRFVQNLYKTFSNIANGGDVTSNLLLGLEHNGISRPLAGLAQVIQGYSTTSKNGLVAVNSGFTHTQGLSELFGGANFARLLGARPLDEAIIMNDMYRRNLYAAKDRAAMESLGETVKSSMLGGKQLSSDQVQDFAAKYAAQGGNIVSFSQKMMQWHQQASSSLANKVFTHMQDPRARQAMMVMGGMPLPDFANMPKINPATTGATGSNTSAMDTGSATGLDNSINSGMPTGAEAE